MLSKEAVFYSFPFSNYADTDDADAFDTYAAGEFFPAMDIQLYTMEKDGSYYLWMEYAIGLTDIFLTGRWIMYYPVGEKTLERAVIYSVVPGHFHDGVAIPTDLVDSWY